MSQRCLWDKSHIFNPNYKYLCNFLCEKCNKEIYNHYRALYKPEQFKENIDKIKNQKKLTMERKWTESEAWIVETLGLDMLVKIDLFDNDLV